MSIQGSRASKAQYLKRVAEIAKKILQGEDNNGVLVQFIAEKWNLKEHQALNYISEARKLIAERVNEDIAYERGLALLRLEDLYIRCYEALDYKGALSVQKERNTLLGLYSPTKFELAKNGKTTLRVAYDLEEVEEVRKGVITKLERISQAQEN